MRAYEEYLLAYFSLPRPFLRNAVCRKKNPWFEIWFMDATGITRQSGAFTSPVSRQPLDWKIVGPR